ncbi:MAG: Mur ligase family protein, partial [Vicingaceae bacterium]
MTKKERSIAVLGAGESGVGAALLALKVGDSVFVSDAGQVKAKYSSRLDQAGIEWEGGVHSEERILQVDLIVKSPGIPSGAEIVKKALDKNIEIISEIEYAFRHCNGKVIAITGSNGKTTTTNLIYHLLKKAGKNACMAGNMGRSFAAEVANGENDYYVLEVSSFQLDDIVEFKPFISILLNITPDHLDRYHQSLREYADAKFNIIRNQGDEDYFIYNLDDEVILEGLKSRSIAAQQVPFTIKKKV